MTESMGCKKLWKTKTLISKNIPNGNEINIRLLGKTIHKTTKPSTSEYHATLGYPISEHVLINSYIA
jgi:hypothetical protein